MLDWFTDTKKPDMSNLDECKYANEPVEEELVYQLSLPYMDRDETNQTKVESKSSLKTRGEKSPDLAEGLGLTFAVELEMDEIPTPRQEILGIGMEDTIVEKPYNPLDYMDDYANSDLQW